MYPPNDYSGGYPPSDYSGGYPPSDYSGGYPPDSSSRSLNNSSSGPPPRPTRKYSSTNNPSVGAGPMSTHMPGFPGGGAPFGGPGGYPPPPPDDIGGFAIPGMGGGYPPNGPQGYGGYPPSSGGYPPQGPPPGGPGFGGPGFGGPGGYPPRGPPFGGPGGGFGYPPGNSGYPPANGPPGGGFGYPPSDNSRPPYPPRNNNPPPNNSGPRPNQGNSRPPPSSQPPRPNTSAPGDQQRPPPIQAQASVGPGPSQYRPQGQQQGPPQQQGLNWRPVTKQNPDIPHNAINAGTYYDSPFFIGRSNYKGSVQVGMVSKKQGGLVIAYDGKPVLFHDFEVLCGPVSSVKWVSVDGRLELAKMKHGKPFACGNEKDGTPLFAGRTTHKDNEYGGKVSEKMKGMLFPHNGKEKRTKEYLVLCSP